MMKDPVCGMKVDVKSAPAISAYEGVTYAFCSPHCKQQFDQQPEQYARKVDERYIHREDELTDDEDDPRTYHQQRQRHHASKWSSPVTSPGPWHDAAPDNRVRNRAWSQRIKWRLFRTWSVAWLSSGSNPALVRLDDRRQPPPRPRFQVRRPDDQLRRSATRGCVQGKRSTRAPGAPHAA